MQDVALAADERAWAPRELPRPLTASAGSRAAAVLDAAAAREALRQAALEEAMRQRAAEAAAAAVDRHRAHRATRSRGIRRSSAPDRSTTPRSRRTCASCSRSRAG